MYIYIINMYDISVKRKTSTSLGDLGQDRPPSPGRTQASEPKAAAKPKPAAYRWGAQ